MEQIGRNKLMQDLALALMYLSSWEEEAFNETVCRAWKGYDFDIIDQLKEEGMIDFSYKAKSLCLSEEGIKKAKELVERFMCQD